ncbi:MAG: riboflavin synthase [Candidatus Gracilibacteria bacterium]|nr:riboflavin synthase [Candidatus Gracilibacteria bacterium]
MFTGIISSKAKILSIDNGTFTIENTFGRNMEIGESIAHDGACMTIEKADKEKYSFFAMKESLKKTNFGEKKPGDYFNVEESLRLGDKMGGHFVTGHVDTTGKVEKIDFISDGSLILYINFDKLYKNNIIDKGSITINGVSLTIVDNGDDFLSVSLIPLTQEITNLGELKVGDAVNLEFDMLGKYVQKITKN